MSTKTKNSNMSTSSSNKANLQINYDQPLNWIHCNRCYHLYILKDRRFILFACEHINCENCAPKKSQPDGRPHSIMNSYKCLDCKRFTKGREINSNMDANTKILFHPQPYLPDLPYDRIWTFQNKHREHLDKYLEKEVKELNFYKEKRQKCQEEAAKYYQEYNKLKRDYAILKRKTCLIVKQRKELELRL